MMLALNPWKLYRSGDSVAAGFSLSLWGILLMLVFILYVAVTGDTRGEPAFYAFGLLTLLPTIVSISLFTWKKS